MLAASDWAYIGGAVSVPIITGIFGVIFWKLNNVYKQVRSPNGATTAALNYDAWKASLELRESLAEVREAQLDHRHQHIADSAAAKAAHGRLESKVDLIAAHQRKHELRFAHLFDSLNLADPAEGDDEPRVQRTVD